MGLLGGVLSLGASIIGGKKQAKASKKAAQLQYDAAMKGVAENARQFDATRADFAPYQEAGASALGKFGDLLGLNGGETQQSEIDLLRETPLYKSLYGAGEEAVLANASATGGLRGGNTQHGLAEFGEDTLARMIERQLGGYRDLIGVGSGAAGQVGAFGANSVAQQNAGRMAGADAQAQDRLIRGGIQGQNWQNFGDILGGAIGGMQGGFDWKKLLF